MALLLSLSLSGYTQSIPEGATGIDVKTTMADSSLYETARHFLDMQGYVLETADVNRLILITERRQEVSNVRIQVLVTVGNGTAHFTAEGHIVTDDTTLEGPFTYSGYYRVGFLSLNVLAEKFAQSLNLPVSYVTLR